MHDLLSTSTPALLFTVIGLGYFLGHIRIAGISLGIAAVVFVGLFFGALNPTQYVIPEVIYVLGLILFVYTVGVQSGPVFFNVFRRQWLKLTLLAACTTGLTALLAVVAVHILHISYPVASGLFCGSLTNTPALAAAVEALRNMWSGSTMDPGELRRLLDGPTVGYSVAYPFGVVGVVLAMQIATRLSRIDFRKEEQKANHASGLAIGELLTREVRVTNPQLVGKTFEEAMLTDLTGMVFTRVKRGTEIDLVAENDVLRSGDVLVGVGSSEAVQKAQLLIGPTVNEAVEEFSPDIGYRDLVVIHRKVAGMQLSEVSAAIGHPVIVSRIRRGGVHITPVPEVTLEMGDQIRVVTHAKNLELVTGLIGNPVKDISEADFLSFSFGLVLGVAVGMIPIPIFGGHSFKLGFAGGPLVVGLILGRLGRTGPIVWTMPSNASFTLRQLGILFFLAGVGTRAGGSFVQAVTSQGLVLLLTGFVLTTASATAILVAARKIFKYDMISAYGILAGIHTQPAALAFANTHTGSENTNISYAAVYPVALISKLILAQLLVGL